MSSIRSIRSRQVRRRVLLVELLVVLGLAAACTGFLAVKSYDLLAWALTLQVSA